MFKPVECHHVLGNGKSARLPPLHACSLCGKAPAILGVLPYSKKEQEYLDQRNKDRVAAAASVNNIITTKVSA